MGLLTKSPKALFDEFPLDITKLRIDVRDIDCAADDEWCHHRVFTTYTIHQESRCRCHNIGPIRMIQLHAFGLIILFWHIPIF